MRYQQIETVSFTNVYGDSYAVKTMREYPDYQTSVTVGLLVGDRLDEIASRQEHYGDGSEGDSYKLFEHNRVAIVENSFQLDGIKKIEIPRR